MYKVIHEALDMGEGLLRVLGVRSARIDVEVLMAYCLGVDREFLVIHEKCKIRYRELKEYFSVLERRASGEPVSYIVEKKEFYSMEYYVNRNVLIPRPESELMVEYVLKRKGDGGFGGVNLLEVGVGSGCLSLSMKNHWRGLEVEGLEICEKALKVAIKNMKCLGLEVSYKISDLFEVLGEGYYNRYDWMVCNLPYIESGEMGDLMEDVRMYEPRVGLDGGGDGLELYRRVSKGARKYMDLKGGESELMIEIGGGQLDVAVGVFRSEGFEVKEVILDYSGASRVIIFEWGIGAG